MLTRDQLVAPNTKEITTEKGSVVIRELSAEEAISLSEMNIKSKEIFEIVALSFFEPKMIAADVGLMPQSMLKKLIKDIFEFNGLAKKSIAEAEEELKKTTSAEQPTQ